MRVLISGGGTGGHVYPALAVAAELPAAADPVQTGVSPRTDAQTPVELLWVGSNGGMEQALVERAGIPFRWVSTGKLRGANPLAAARTLRALHVGVRQSQAILASWRPDVCFVTGGYVCAPVVIACALRKVPVCIYLPDMTPGWTIKWMSRVAQRVCVSFAQVAPHFGGEAPMGKAVVTGYPVRADLVEWAQDRSAARRRLSEVTGMQMEDQVPLLLVWGGSQGSRAITTALWKALPAITPHAHILHVIGTRDWPIWQERASATREALGEVLWPRYHPVDYLHDEMAVALAAADLSVARAGASTLGEFPVAHLPSILAPLVGVNQQANADLLADAGGALVVADEDLERDLAPTLVELLTNPQRRLAMSNALGALARPQAALAIAREIIALGRRAPDPSALLSKGHPA